MRHLRTFENINYNNIKKYIIWKDTMEDNDYYILDVYDFKQDIIYVNYLYYYKNKLKKVNIDFKHYIDNNFDDIKYTSDDLEDCINKIYIIANSDKYNL